MVPHVGQLWDLVEFLRVRLATNFWGLGCPSWCGPPSWTAHDGSSSCLSLGCFLGSSTGPCSWWPGSLSTWICSLAIFLSEQSCSSWARLFTPPGLLAWDLSPLIFKLPCWISKLNSEPLPWQLVGWPLRCLLVTILLIDLGPLLPLILVVALLIVLRLWLRHRLLHPRSTTSLQPRSQRFPPRWLSWLAEGELL